MGVRESWGLLDATFQLWGLDSEPVIPSGAALYVPLGSRTITNVSTPNTLPSNTSSEIFLTAQAPVPVTGRIWGVVAKRINSSNPAYVRLPVYNASDVEYFYTLDDGSSISVLSQLNQIQIHVIGFAEVGMSTGFGGLLDGAAPWGYNSANSGLDEEEVFEFVLWQTFWNPPGTTGNFTTVQDPIPELEDEHSNPYNPFGSLYPWNGNMTAIGIRCTSSSVAGTATVNGLAGTFTVFEREDPDSDTIPRFSLGVPLTFLQLEQTDINYIIINTNYNWIQPLFVAANAKIDLDSAVDFPYYESLIQTPELQNAFIAAYQQYAIQTMFFETFGDALGNNNVTTAVPWTII